MMQQTKTLISILYITHTFVRWPIRAMVHKKISMSGPEILSLVQKYLPRPEIFSLDLR